MFSLEDQRALVTGATAGDHIQPADCAQQHSLNLGGLTLNQSLRMRLNTTARASPPKLTYRCRGLKFDSHHQRMGCAGPIPVARKIFMDATLGDLGIHNYSQPHPVYNKAVMELWNCWTKNKNIAQLTEDQALQFLTIMRTSKYPRIGPYLEELELKAAEIATSKAASQLTRSALKRKAKKILGWLPFIGIAADSADGYASGGMDGAAKILPGVSDISAVGEFANGALVEGINNSSCASNVESF